VKNIWEVPKMQKEQQSSKFYYGWVVIFIVFLTLLVSAAISSFPSILIQSLEQEYGWNRAAISGVISVRILLYGLMGPFSAALMARFGIRRMMVIAMILVSVSLGLTPLMTQVWHLVLLWGILGGLGTGALANVLGVTVANRWFVKHKGLVIGLLTASAATGQLLFLPLLAKITSEIGWRYAVYAIIAALLLLLPIVAIWMRNHPFDVGVAPLGTTEVVKPTPFKGNLFLTPILVLGSAMRSGRFWLLAGTFFFCGFSTNGLIGVHLIPACGGTACPNGAVRSCGHYTVRVAIRPLRQQMAAVLVLRTSWTFSNLPSTSSGNGLYAADNLCCFLWAGLDRHRSAYRQAHL
jgi:MFS family permease